MWEVYQQRRRRDAEIRKKELGPTWHIHFIENPFPPDRKPETEA